MDADRFREQTYGLLAQVEALGALAARMRARAEGLELTDERRARLDAVAEALGLGEPGPPEVEQVVLGFARAFLRQASALIDDPNRSPSWEHADPVLVRGMGQGSANVADALEAAVQARPAVAAALSRPGAAVLDVGTGAGGLARALTRVFPAAKVVGLDLSPVAIGLARADLADLGDRVELRQLDVCALTDQAAFDLVWLPGPFLPRVIVPSAVACAWRALRPGGLLAFGTFGGARTPLAAALSDLRTDRSGGHPWRDAELEEVLRAAGFAEVAPVPPTWKGPVGLVVGTRAS